MDDDEMGALALRVRMDTRGFARDVEAMRGALEGPLAGSAERAGSAIERSLTRALAQGRFGFDDLRRVALSVLGDIASAAIRGGIGALLGGAGGGGGAARGLSGILSGLLGGAPGRATGGPVAPGAAYWVGERGPELFVPTASGRIAAVPGEAPRMGGTIGGAMPAIGQAIPPTFAPAAGAPPREVRVAITVNARGGEAPAALAQSSRQVARAVRSALMEMD